MKAVLLLILAGAIIAAIFLLARSEKALTDDPEIRKFAMVNAELAIGFEQAGEDSLTFIGVRDSILRQHGVDTAWVQTLTDRIDRHPKQWPDVYQLMIEHAEKIKDSLMHRTRPAGDSAEFRP